MSGKAASSALRPWFFITLDRRWPLPRWLLSLLLFLLFFAVLAPLFDLWPAQADHEAWRVGLGVCLFFCFINAYVLTMTAAVIERTQRALDSLRPELNLSAADFQIRRDALAGATAWQRWQVGLAGLAIGWVHGTLLFQQNSLGDNDLSQTVGSLLGTVTTWLFMVHVISALVRNAALFDQLGRQSVRIDILRPGTLVGFGTAGTLPALALMGTQAAYPLLSLGGFNAWVSLPGFTMTLATVVYLLFRPMWGVHVHLRESKRALLGSIDSKLRQWRDRHPDQNLAGGDLGEISNLLQFRTQVISQPEWPFNPGSAARWFIYVVIPPMTWVLAALVENLVDGWTNHSAF